MGKSAKKPVVEAKPTPNERPPKKAKVQTSATCDVCGTVTDAKQCPVDGRLMSEVK